MTDDGRTMRTASSFGVGTLDRDAFCTLKKRSVKQLFIFETTFYFLFFGRCVQLRRWQPRRLRPRRLQPRRLQPRRLRPRHLRPKPQE